MNAAAVELDEAMGVNVRGREVIGLTNNAVFQTFEEPEPLQEPGSPPMFFTHEHSVVPLMVVQDQFENLPNAVFVPSNDNLVVLPLDGGTGGAGGSGSSGGAVGSVGAGSSGEVGGSGG